MIVVRDATATDVAAWRAIVLEAANEASTIATWPTEVWTEAQLVERIRTMDRDALAFLVAQNDGVVAGVAGLHRGARPATRHTAEFGVTIAQAHRGRGLGTALIAEMERRARAWGVTKMCLGVFAHNEGAARLYRRLGYQEEGIRRGHYLVGGTLRDEILMAKRLDGAAP